ncbi:magnesium transporter CorA family protein [Sulfitobacter sp. LCG007]
MILAYQLEGAKLVPLGAEEDLGRAIWIDVVEPDQDETARVAALGQAVPSLEEMEEIEISNRLYHEDEADYMTVVLPGQSTTQMAMTGPVTFILSRQRLVTVRHHSPRPFETYPGRADKVGVGCKDPESLFLSLLEEIVGRLADLLEITGKKLDELARQVYSEDLDDTHFRGVLRELGHGNEQIGRIRLALMTMERAISYFGQTLEARQKADRPRGAVKGLLRDLQALVVHGDYLSGRVAMTTDATLGMINLAQAATTKTLSVVAAVFLPPTLIASIYGMNFADMPELGWEWGYPLSLLSMLATGVGAYLFFKWRKWL